MADAADLDLTTVFAGPPWLVMLLEGRMEAAGIPSFVPDRLVKTIDPFITGASPLDLRLQVPAAHLADARALVEEYEAEERRAAAVPSPEAAELAVDRHGRRIRWAALFGVTAPFALYYAPRYVRAAAALPARPRSHAWTLAAFPLAVLTGALALWWLTGFLVPENR